jgi:hypothetical protein
MTTTTTAYMILIADDFRRTRPTKADARRNPGIDVMQVWRDDIQHAIECQGWTPEQSAAFRALIDTTPTSTDTDDDTDVGEAITPAPDAILRHYGATMTTGSEGESVSEQALTREAARACVAALTAAGIEASEAPDHEDRSMSWIYVGGAIEPDITADTITDRQIWALRDEAAAAGDEAQVIICDIALTFGLADMIDPGEHRAALEALGIIPEHIDADVRARAECARVIAQG